MKEKSVSEMRDTGTSREKKTRSRRGPASKKPKRQVSANRLYANTRDLTSGSHLGSRGRQRETGPDFKETEEVKGRAG